MVTVYIDMPLFRKLLAEANLLNEMSSVDHTVLMFKKAYKCNFSFYYSDPKFNLDFAAGIKDESYRVELEFDNEQDAILFQPEKKTVNYLA